MSTDIQLHQNEKKRAKNGKTAKNKPCFDSTPDIFTTLCGSALGEMCVREYAFHPTRKWRFDYALPSFRIALEVEGGVFSYGRHTRPHGFLGDIEKYNTAALMGWRVFRTTPKELLTEKTLSLLRHAINHTYPTKFGVK